MQVFERDSITLTVFSSKRWDIHNDNIDIEVTLNDGRRFAATLFTLPNLAALLQEYSRSGECASGTFVWCVQMIVLRDLSEDSIFLTVRELASTGEIKSAMLAIE